MTIEKGYYVSDRASTTMPEAKRDQDTFYLPINVVKNEDGIYEYQEYRFNLPISYDFPSDILEKMATTLDEYRRALKEVGVL